ncbi:MAG: glycerate kinase [Candidatus Cryptobacteroides sp.]
MKIVIAPDSYKECLSARAVADAMASAVLEKWTGAEVVELPLSDGGEGTLDVIAGAMDAELVQVEVSDPLGRAVSAEYAVAGNTVVIEVAQACGITRLSPSERNPLIASSRGVGELIVHAYSAGFRDFIIGLGGTVTCDGGEGMLGVPGIRAALAESRVEILSDVNVPFVGPSGAARMFALQKGASPADVELIEARMKCMARRIAAETGVDVSGLEGAGAAGGLGGAFIAYAQAKVSSGADRVMDMVGFDNAIQGAGLVITGEGKSDAQTLRGKLPFKVLLRSRPIPVVLLSGRVEAGSELIEAGFARVEQVSHPGRPLSVEILPEVAEANIRNAIARLAGKS